MTTSSRSAPCAFLAMLMVDGEYLQNTCLYFARLFYRSMLGLLNKLYWEEEEEEYIQNRTRARHEEELLQNRIGKGERGGILTKAKL